MLRWGEDDVDGGAVAYEARHRSRILAHLKTTPRGLGKRLLPVAASPPNPEPVSALETGWVAPQHATITAGLCPDLKEQFQSELNLPRGSDGAYDSPECAVGNCHRATGDGHAEHR